MNKIIKTIADLSEDYVCVSRDIEVREILENLGFKAEGVDTLYVKLDKSGADYESVYGCMGTPVMGKAVIKIK